MKTIAEQIAAFEARRTSTVTRMTEIMGKAATDGTTLDQAEQDEYDGLEQDIEQIDGHIKRLKSLEKHNVAAATAVVGENGEQASAARAGVRLEVKGTNLPKGTAFTRYATALMRSKGNLMQAAEIAKGWHDSTPEVETVLRAAVAAGTTTGNTWAAPLVQYQTMASEFVELLRPATIIGKIVGLRHVPFNVKIPRQTAGASVGWVGEGAPKPVGSLAFDMIQLGWAKAAGIVVMSDELVRLSNPSAEDLVRTDLINTMAQFLDAQFVDPSIAAVANVSPASITNGATYITASGTDQAALKHDVQILFGLFIAANLSLADAVWIMTPTMAMSIGLMTNALGQFEYPDINMNGGKWMGLPVIVSTNVPQSVVNGGAAPPTVAGDQIILAKASDILLADDGAVELDASTEASLQMNSAPDNPATAATVLTSLWQNNLVALRAERYINWMRRRAQAVAYISGAKYVAS
ncbi:phage major capsid protein [Sphingomonas nostoxanthinifaciens]|uniref:phage major capsid protein n=1 Tax=Sphingomonas nostoxanthinifaciens TaxID=2872652 RepID=UPI001CC21576|nr:phage major capsid protein [Sphingomonas nostoxanthinifaciens]UAK23662.1 phage major capsid protein [Sphingomonas nostoxanthinifaciens]